jgi:hypothetical protein
MKALRVFGIVATFSVACAGTVASVQFQPEKDSVLHLGQIAALSVPSNGHFSIGSAGTALVLMKRERQRGNTVYVYRAVKLGNQSRASFAR